MSEPSRAGMERLSEALELWLRHQERPDCSDAELLERHPTLRDLLAPMFAEESPARGEEQTNESVAEPTEQAFGDFRIVGEIGRGGMGVVYEAVQRSLGRRVALKVLAQPLVMRPDLVARFRREGELLGRLNHPHIVPVYEAGFFDEVPYHAMECVDGCSLADALAALEPRRDGGSIARAVRSCLGEADAGERLVGRSHVEAAVRLVLTVAEALSAAHDEGILHRDVKPANVLLRRDGTVLLSDFGLARDMSDPHLSRSGDFLGTPHYVSPEQAAGEVTVDARSDVFSLAVVLYETLLGARPFEAESTNAVLERVRHHDPVLLRGRAKELPADLVAVLDKAMRKQPAARYESMAAFAADLRRFLDLQPVRARRRTVASRVWQAARRQPQRVGLLAAVLAGLVVSGYLFWELPRIRSAARAERIVEVERLLETIMMGADFGFGDTAEPLAQAAYDLVPDLPESVAGIVFAKWLAGEDEAMRAHLAELRAIAPDVAEQFELRSAAPEPESALGWFVRGMLQIEEGHDDGDRTKYFAAARSMHRAIMRAPEPRALYHCQHLHALMHLGDRQQLRDVADATRRLWPNSAFARYWCGFALVDYDPDAALADLMRALELEPDLPQIHARFARALEAKSAERALAVYRKVAELAPHASVVWQGLARALLAMGEPVQAYEAVQKALQLNPDNFISIAIEGRVLARLDRPEEALAAFERAMKAGPNAATPWWSRARFHLARGRIPEALADAERACEHSPGSITCHSARGTILLSAGRPADAAEAFDLVTRAWPTRLHGWKSLAMARRRAGDLDGAERAVQRSLELGAESADVYRELGKLRRAQKKPAAAEAAFLRVMELDPDDGEARVNLAGLRMQAGRNEEALALLADARRNQPRLQEAWYPAMGLLKRLGRHAEEIELRSRFLEQWPHDNRTRVRLGAAILRLPPAEIDTALLERTLQDLEERDIDTRELRRRANAILGK